VAFAAQDDGTEIEMYCEEREAALILDTQGRVVHCSPAANALLGQHADTMVDLPVKAVFPKLPMSPQTPGYNLAYAAIHGTRDNWMLHWAQTLGGGCIGLLVRFGRVKMNGALYIALTLSADMSVRAAAPLFCASARGS
jgi:PAS domain-containing protein